MRTFAKSIVLRCAAAGSVALATLMLAACGGGSGGASVTTPDPAPAPDSTPVITGTPATTATVGSEYTFTPQASDADGDQLTFEITGKPTWAEFNAETGELSGVPPAHSSGNVSHISIEV